MCNHNLQPWPSTKTDHRLLKPLFQATFIIHMALVIGQVLFGIVAYSINKKNGNNYRSTDDLMMYLVPVVAIVSFVISILIYRQLIIRIPIDATLMQKLTGYQTAMIVRDALLEAPSLFAIVTYLTTGNLMFLVVSGIIVLYFITLRPTRDKLKTDLNLSYEEELELS